MTAMASTARPLDASQQASCPEGVKSAGLHTFVQHRLLPPTADLSSHVPLTADKCHFRVLRPIDGPDAPLPYRTVTRADSNPSHSLGQPVAMEAGRDPMRNVDARVGSALEIACIKDHKIGRLLDQP